MRCLAMTAPSSQRAGLTHRRDLFGVVADRPEDFVGVLSEPRRWTFDGSAVVAELESLERHGHGLPDTRHVLVTVQHPAVLQMRVLERFVQRPDSCRGNVLRLEVVLPLLCGLLPEL